MFNALIGILVGLGGSAMAVAKALPVDQLTPPERCAWMVKVYNHCADTLTFVPEKNAVILKNQTSLVCDDGKNLPFLERLKSPDISSMLSQSYPIGHVPLPTQTKDLSPGGIRQQDFMKAIYGGSAAEVEKNLVKISFLGQTLTFNRKNGAAYQLSLVGNELMSLYALGSDEKLNTFLQPFIKGPCKPDGRCTLINFGYEWRFVKGTTTLSNHSFGTALDMEPAVEPEYWYWDVAQMIQEGKAKWAPGTDVPNPDYHNVVNFTPKANPTYPQSLVDVFEKHGFIWGGKWYRYDIMHFEFRPEFFPGAEFDCGNL